MNRNYSATVSENTLEQMALNPDCNSDPRAELLDPAATIRFLLAGDAHVTFQSRRTGTRFTYRVRLAEPRPGDDRAPPHFVHVLTGPDEYSYLGCIFEGQKFRRTSGSRIAEGAPSSVAFAWVWRTLSGGRMHPELGVWHEGRCGRCGRRLTTPRSLTVGLGPICEGLENA